MSRFRGLHVNAYPMQEKRKSASFAKRYVVVEVQVCNSLKASIFIMLNRKQGRIFKIVQGFTLFYKGLGASIVRNECKNSLVTILKYYLTLLRIGNPLYSLK